MLVPAGAASFAEAMRIAAEAYHTLKRSSHERGLATGVGDEGGFAPDLPSSEAAIEAILEAVERAGHARAGRDRARPRLERVLRDGVYRFEGREPRRRAEMADFCADLVDRYPIVSIEDGNAEDDWDGWASRPSGSATGPARRRRHLRHEPRAAPRAASTRGVANSILIKVNQIGTLTETLDAIAARAGAGYTAVISHRSGETEDTTIADLAVATGAGQIKTGAPARTDRVAKYNQLLRIEEELGDAGGLSGLGRVSARDAGSYAG